MKSLWYWNSVDDNKWNIYYNSYGWIKWYEVYDIGIVLVIKCGILITTAKAEEGDMKSLWYWNGIGDNM